jgi:hypothetical protein
MPARAVESAAEIPYHHTDRSLLLLVLGYVGTPQTLAKDYSRNQLDLPDGKRRLDYVVTNSQTVVLAPLAKSYFRAHVLHKNEKYEVIGLH